MKALLEKIRKILRDRRTRKFLTRLVSGVAAVVVFITTYALVLPAITMESQAACGIEAHQHDDSCYTEELICGQEESEGHHHTEDCYTVTKELVCPLEEHQHSAENGCYDEDGNLICQLEEHTHTDTCYEEHRELTCGLEETDGHHHTDSCYKKVLTCGKPVHTHSAACYKADPEIQSAAVASTGMTSAAATSDYSEEEYAQEESLDGSIGSQAFDEPEEIGAEDQNPGEETIDEGSSSAETEDNQDANQDADVKDENADKEISDEGISQAETENDPVADLENDPVTDLENVNADDNSVAAEPDDMNRNDDSESKDEKDEKADAFETGDTAFEESADEENLNTEDEDNDNNADKEGEESASSFSTGFAAEEDEDSFIPEKKALDFNTVLNNKTGIYYHHLEAGETVEDSSAITDWTRVDEDTELSPEDLIRVYLGYTIPADAINATNDIARYRLPDTLHLTDEQIDAINKCENGISSQYVDYSRLEITDIERHAAYLGLESVEGTRTPDEELKEDSQEFISATVKTEKIYDEDGKYEGIDLIFTFSPYTVEKNAHSYDKDGQPTKAGEKVKGWLMLDFNLGQVDFEDPVITRTAFETSEAESADGFNEDNDHIEYDPAEDDSVEEKNNTENNTVETEDTEDNTDGESGEEADNGQNSPAAIERSERTAEVVFVEDGWDEKGDQINKISTTLRVVEETVIEAENEDALEDSAADNTAETTVEDTGEAATEDAASAVREDAASAATEETADPSANGTTAKETEKDTVDADQVIMPAMSFNDSIKISTGKPAGIEKDSEGTLAEAAGSLPEKAEVFVRVEADEGTFPAGTTMVLSAVDQSSMDTLAETLAETVESGDPSAADTSGSDADDRKDISDHTEDKETNQSESKNNSNTRTYGFQAVDITFLDKDGNEIEPAKPVRVALTSSAVEQTREKVEDSPIADPVVVHVDNEGNAEQMNLVNPEEVEPAKGRSEEELLEEAEKAAEPDKSDKAETDDDANTAATETPADEADDENNDMDAGSGTTGQSADDTANTGIENSVVSTDDAPDTAADNNDAAVDDASDPAVGSNGEASDDASDSAVENNDESADDTSDFAVDNNDADTVEEDVSAGNEDGDASEESATAEGTTQVNTTAEEDGESADTAEFTADSFSVYAIVYTVELYTNVITDSGETYRITVTYDETSGIPQDAELKVKEIKEGDKGYKDYYTEAVKAASESSDAQNDASDKDNKRVNPDKTYARFFDIEIWANGEKIEPSGDVSVSIRLLDVPETDDKSVIKIVHFAQDDIEVIPHTETADHAESLDTTKDQDDKQAESSTSGEMEFNFTTSSFSVYSVVSYTVDFHWVVDGEEYTFSIKGGSAIAFSDLLPIIGVVKDDSETEVNEVRKFIENVQSVSFSNPKLLSVSKVESDTTVEAIKDRLGLECEYSADLTEEQIEEINNTKIQSGDWILISLKSFQSEETITVTMDKGGTFTIKVTDPPGTITTVDTKQMGLTMNLFDYGPDDLDHVNNALGTGPQDLAEENYADTGINQYSDLKFFSRGTVGTGINNFTGSMPYEMAAQGIVQTGLIGGYPALYNNQSLDYLFNMDEKTGKTVYANVNHLFKWENGELKYNSDENYAYYTGGNAGGGNFKVYNTTFHEEGADNANFFIGFFPFNDYNSDYKCIHGKEFNWNKKPGCNEHQGHYNHHFGLSMEGTFQIRNNEDMTFHFSGDDDMWVFVDDVLVLDIGGIHNPIDGNIDFKNKTVSVTKGSNTAADARQAVTGQTIAPDTITAAFAREGKTWDGTDGSYHEIKVFYLERGGMYSNLEMEINLPFVPSGKLPFNKKNDSNEALAGAKFSIYTDPACQHPLSFKSENASAISDENGVVSFSGLPVGTYYMKETTVPDGYQLDPSVYTVILKDKNGGEASIIRNPSGQNVTTIVNNEITIDLSVQKNWQNADKTPITPENSYSSTFQVRRLRSYELPGVNVLGDDTTLVIRHVRNTGDWAPFNQEEYKYKRGQQITINYNYNNQSASNNERKYRYYNGYTTTPIPNNNIPFQSYNNDAGNTGSINVTIPENGVYLLEFYDIKDSLHPNGVVTWTITDGATQGETHTDEPDTGYTGPTLTLSNGNTTGTFNSGLYSGTVNEGKFPVQKIIDGVKYTYKYYIVETTPQDGFEPVYVDGSNNEIPKENLETNASSIATGTGGTQTIINRKLMNIPVVKYWPDYNSDEYTWTAKLQLDYRNVPLNDPEHPGNWTPLSPSQIVEVSKSDTQQKFFTGLPMYYTDSAGRHYRREYSVIETGYKVTRDNHIVAEYDNSSNPPIIPPIEHRYTPWYIHDAGEVPESGTVSIEDYSDITVQNMLQRPDIEKQMELNVEKTWSDDKYLNDSNAKAVFQLKRYVITEYRNYESQAPITDWVVITLDTGTDHNQKMTVPKNTTMYIRGYLKEGAEGDITFSSGISPSTRHVSYDSSDQGAFGIEFTADTTKTIKLATGNNNGADLVIGGTNGFRLSETNSIQSATIDNSFCIEFELSKDKGWSKHFPETSQESHDNQNHDSEPESINVLPVIEVSLLDDQGLTANTYIYRYFLEEVSCQPEGFNATFTDNTGNVLLGDESHQFYFDTTIKANNRQTGLAILKVDMEHPENPLADAKFQLRKLDGEPGEPPVPAQGGTYTGTTVPPDFEATNSEGIITFTPPSGLSPGYYEVTETLPPAGYVLLEDSKFYIKVEKLGIIKLADKDEDGNVIWPDEEQEGVQTVGNVSISSSITAANGKTITVTVPNQAGTALPASGGPGTKFLYVFGAILTIFAGLILARRRC